MKMRRKVWAVTTQSLMMAAGMASAVQAGPNVTHGESGERADAAQGSQPPAASVVAEASGSFAKVVNDVLMGEGGEHAGTLEGGAVSFKALTSAQIRQLLAGNTLRVHNNQAIHYRPDGSLTGWEMSNGVVRNAQKISGGWRVENDHLCVQKNIDATAQPESCTEVVLVISNIVFYGGDGKAVAVDQELAGGEALDRE